MQIPAIQPGQGPFNGDSLDRVNQLVQGLSPEQGLWLAGYLSGVCNSTGGAPSTGAAVSGDKVTILFGSQTGNGEKLARELEGRGQALGLAVQVKDLADYKPAFLKKEKFLLLIASTHGEGDPPDTAEELHRFLHGKRAPKLEGLKYSVLSLGDSSYEHFCKTGIDFDEGLAAQGAQALVPRQDCDLDYEDDASRWMDAALAVLQKEMGGGAASAATFTPSTATSSKYNKKNPFAATVLEKTLLNGRGSDKETWHVELSLEGSDLHYKPGDALGILPENNPGMVDEILAALAADPAAEVEIKAGTFPLREALMQRLEITTIIRPFLKSYAEKTGHAVLQALLGEDAKDALREYLYGRELIDVLLQFAPGELTAQEFVSMLRPLPPRLYSIASSIETHPEEVHLTIAATRYEAHGREREGVCSVFVADRVAEDETMQVYIDPNPNFHLPADPGAPLIMVGPGTGVAPFRAFLEERESTGATGRNWLFFGDRHFTTDFLYQAEWQTYLKDGLLSRLDVAFSRDQAEKVYVQDRMEEQAAELWNWLQDGACFYVCGDESRMAHDVHEALITLVQQQGGKSRDDAEAYVKQLQKDRRYLRDVY